MDPNSRTRPAKRRVNGVFLLDKPTGLSSNRALQQVKRIFNAQKAGHTGSLDPLASGLLPICLGNATRVGQYLLSSAKTYRAAARLGQSSSTGDAEGEISAPIEVPELDLPAWQAIATTFLGDSTQIPPMYSALKHNGQRLYKLARSGQQVERPARPIHIDAISVHAVTSDELVFEASVSSGTYIRTLVEDLAKSGGSLAYTASLRRTAIGALDVADALSLDELEQLADPDTALRPLEIALTGMSVVQLNAAEAARFVQGQRLATDCAVRAGEVRVIGPEDQLLGLGRLDDDAVLAPWKVFID